jgi:hypothetical protein
VQASFAESVFFAARDAALFADIRRLLCAGGKFYVKGAKYSGEFL